MLTAPRVTVLIPAYKALETLEKAVKSIINQSEPGWELLIIDDCSPDATGALADQLALLDHRIRVIHQPQNHGKPAALNLGTEQAQGRWIALLDSDDWYAPTRLATLCDAGEAANVTMVADNQIFFDGKANNGQGAEAGMALPTLTRNIPLGIAEFLASSNASASFDYGMLKPIFRADFIKTNNLTYYEPARIGEDYLILLRFFAAGGTALLVHQSLYYYLQPFGTISRQWAQEGRGDYNFALLEKINQAGIEQTRHKLTAEQIDILQQRGAAIAALARLANLRIALKNKAIIKAVCLLCTAPLSFWRLIGQRLCKKAAHRQG